LNKSQMVLIAEIDEQIRNRLYPTLKSLSLNFGVSDRTIRRYIHWLEDSLHAPLAIHPTRKGFYYTKEWEFPKMFTGFANHAQHLYQLVKALKLLGPSDRQYVIDASEPTPPATLPPAGLMTFATGTLSLPIQPPSKFRELISQVRDLTADERRFVLNSL